LEKRHGLERDTYRNAARNRDRNKRVLVSRSAAAIESAPGSRRLPYLNRVAEDLPLDGRRIVAKELRHQLEVRWNTEQCALIIVDECSTVDAAVAKDLLSYQIPVLTLGDPFQLPSIDGIEFFMNAKPDATLTEVLRQEKTSPILELGRGCAGI
jgi:hypothetical protein